VNLLLDYRPALTRRTGVGEYAHELAAALSRTARPADHLTLFTSSWRDRPDPSLRDWPAVTVVDRRVPVRLLNWAWHRRQWPPIEWLTGPIDVALSMHPVLLPTRAAHQVITIFDLDFLRHPERTTAEIRRDYPALVRDHARRARLVVVISEDTARSVQVELRVPSERIVLCRPGLPGWIGQPAARPEPVPGYVLFVGTLEPRKNIGTLLDAWTLLVKRVPNLPKLRLAGAAPPEAGTWLARLQVPPLAGRVEYVGYIPDVSRREVYTGARLLVLPSWHEGFGLPALEAMALGVPVVVSNRGALPEVVGDAGLLLSPDDARGLAAAIESVLRDPLKASAMSARGLVQAAGFTWDAAALRLREAFDRLPPLPAHA
jgi:glycosyltransferase involved in cell wall biosynthesis